MKTPAPSNDDVAHVIQNIRRRVLAHLRKKGYINKHGKEALNPILDPLIDDSPFLKEALSASAGGKIAFGENAGKKVRKIHSGFGYEEEVPFAKGELCCSIGGFNIHGARKIKKQDRHKLRDLISYMGRGAIANERIDINKSGDVIYTLKRSYSDSTQKLIFTPLEFLEKLSAIIPPPKIHLINYTGCFAPHFAQREKIILKPHVKKGFGKNDESCTKDKIDAKKS